MAANLTLDRADMKNRATSHLRIYVGGISDNCSVDDVYEHFIPYGQINGIVINRNFGFVQFEKEESAQEAITKANGSNFQGKLLSVRTAQSNPDKRRDTEVNVPFDTPPAIAISDNNPVSEEGGEDAYDNYGNFKGDANYRDEDYDEGYNGGWNARGGDRGRGARGRGRPVRGRGAPVYTDRTPAPVRGGYDRYAKSIHDYPPRAVPVTERNDCEIIVVSKTLTEYAEYIETRLKHLGIVVDLLFPMEDVPIGKVLGNIAARGCLYAILVMPQNQEHKSITLTILHGLPQEHRNMPLEDALQLLSRNFQEVQRGGPSGREAVYALLGQLADGRTLTVLQYDKVIEYLQDRREQQVKIELGEPLSTPVNNKAQSDLQQRILTILNEKKSQPEPPAPVPAPFPVQPPTQSKLLSDPTVRKALDSILQKFT